jgi:hypothetical protein
MNSGDKLDGHPSKVTSTDSQMLVTFVLRSLKQRNEGVENGEWTVY